MIDLDKTISRIKRNNELELGSCADLKRIEEAFSELSTKLQSAESERDTLRAELDELKNKKWNLYIDDINLDELKETDGKHININVVNDQALIEITLKDCVFLGKEKYKSLLDKSLGLDNCKLHIQLIDDSLSAKNDFIALLKAELDKLKEQVPDKKTEYKLFCDWCENNTALGMDARLHTHSGRIEDGGYIDNLLTNIAFRAWRDRAELLSPTLPTIQGD